MKNKIKFFIVTLLIFQVHAFAQNRADSISIDSKRYLVVLPEFCDSIGFVFTSEYEISKLYQQFTPSMNEIIQSERVISSVIDMVYGAWHKAKSEVIKKLRTFPRQYFGKIKNNEKEIIISIIDPAMPKEYYSDFKDYVDHPTCPESYIDLYHINLSTNEITNESFCLLLLLNRLYEIHPRREE